MERETLLEARGEGDARARGVELEKYGGKLCVEPLGLHNWRQGFFHKREACLMPFGHRDGATAFPATGERSHHAALSLWLMAALTNVLGMRPCGH